MTPNKEEPRFFAYLDHNILDLMIKGDPLGTKALLKEISLIPVFSDEIRAESQTCFQRAWLLKNV